MTPVLTNFTYFDSIQIRLLRIKRNKFEMYASKYVWIHFVDRSVFQMFNYLPRLTEIEQLILS